MMKDPCNRCKREGLAILPVIYAVMPNDKRYAKLIENLPAKTSRSSSGVITEVFTPEAPAPKDAPGPEAPPFSMNALNVNWPKPPSGQFGAGVTDKTLAESDYYLRSPEAGYIYILYPDGRWQGYLVDTKGYLQLYHDLSVEDMPNEPPKDSKAATCEAGGKSHAGVQALCIEDTDNITGTVYIAYSRYKWTKAVRDKHALAPAQRMQAIEKLDGSAFTHAVQSTADNISQWVADYRPGAAKLLNPLLPQDAQLTDRSEGANALSSAMRAMGGKLERKVPFGIIMALHDPVGITRSLSMWRNSLAVQAAESAGAFDPIKARKRVVAETIQTIYDSAQRNPGPFYDRNYGPERFTRRIDEGAWRSALKLSATFNSLQQRIDRACLDYVKWQRSALWKEVQAHDFDEAVRESTEAHCGMVAQCVTGSGLSDVELQEVWQNVLALPAEDKHNWFVRALGAMDKTFAQYVSGEKREDRVYEVLTRLVDLGKTPIEQQLTKAQAEADAAEKKAIQARAGLAAKTQEAIQRARQAEAQAEQTRKRAEELAAQALEQYRAHVEKTLNEAKKAAQFLQAEAEAAAALHARLITRRQATAAMSEIINQSTAVLMRLQKKDPRAYKKLVRTVAASLLTRADLVAQPYLSSGKVSDLAKQMIEGAQFQPPVAPDSKAKAPAQAPRLSEMASALDTGNIDALFQRPTNREGMSILISWALTKLIKEKGQLEPHVLTRLNLQHIDLERFARAMEEAAIDKMPPKRAALLRPKPGSTPTASAEPTRLPPWPPAEVPKPASPPAPQSAPSTVPTAPSTPTTTAPTTNGMPAKPPNPYLVNQGMLLGARIDTAANVGAMFFQLYSIGVAWGKFSEAYRKNFGAEDLADGVVGMVTAGLGLFTAAAEINSAQHLLKSNLLRAAELQVLAGRLTVAAGVIESAWNLYQGGSKLYSGKNMTSGWWSVGTSVAVLATTFAAHGVYQATAAHLVALHATRSLMAAEAAGVYLRLGPKGWTILVILLVGAAVYANFQAVGTDEDNLLPVEYWLDNGTFGKRQAQSGKLYHKGPFAKEKHTEQEPFRTLEEEMLSLQNLLYAAQGQVRYISDRNGFSTVCSYNVVVPRYAKGSTLKLEFCVIDEGKAYDAGYVLCQDGQATALDTIHPGLKGLREGPTLEIDKETGQMRVSGLFSTLKDPMLFGLLKDKTRMYADRVVMRVTYVPDEISMPKLTSQFVSPKDETWRGAAKA